MIISANMPDWSTDYVRAQDAIIDLVNAGADPDGPACRYWAAVMRRIDGGHGAEPTAEDWEMWYADEEKSAQADAEHEAHMARTQAAHDEAMDGGAPFSCPPETSSIISTSGGPRAETYARNEAFLGPVRGVMLPDKEKGSRATRAAYELNIIDGWVRISEWTDESGLMWDGERHTPSRVRAVLDAAPECVDFIVESHWRWIETLRAAGRSRQASAQHRALNDALRRHGLALRVEQ